MLDRIFRGLDAVLGTALVAALALAVLTALPTPAHAFTERVTATGPVTSETRRVEPFDAIAVTGGIDVRVRQGGEEAVVVHTQANLLPLLETLVETSDSRRTLLVRWKKGTRVSLSQPPRVEVTAARLQALASTGASDIVVDGFKTPTLTAAIAGSGDITLNALTGDELTVKIAGSGDLKASGQVTRLTVGVSGSGDVRTEELRAEHVSIRIAGSGDAAVHAAQTLEVSIAGSGDVVYRGEPQVKTSVAGSGSVRKR